MPQRYYRTLGIETADQVDAKIEYALEEQARLHGPIQLHGVSFGTLPHYRGPMIGWVQSGVIVVIVETIPDRTEHLDAPYSLSRTEAGPRPVQP